MGGAALGKTLAADPEALPVIGEHFHRGAAPIPRHKYAAAERIVFEYLARALRESVDVTAKIRWLDCYEDTRPRG